MKAGFKTFADQLMSEGVIFSPETVIINISALPFKMKELGGYRRALDEFVYPPFDYCILEDNDPDSPASRALYCVWNHAHKSIHSVEYLWAPEIGYWASEFGFTGLGDLDQAMNPDAGKRSQPDFSVPAHFQFSPRDEFREMLVLCICAFGLMQQKAELEVVDGYSRQVRRQAERKTGKAPSPYYVLDVVLPAKRKVYPGRSDGVGAAPAAERAAHLVRGHFLRQPPTHPLPQFAGKTFWIPAHGRGDKATGTKEKIYRIVVKDGEGG